MGFELKENLEDSQRHLFSNSSLQFFAYTRLVIGICQFQLMPLGFRKSQVQFSCLAIGCTLNEKGIALWPVRGS